MPAFFLHLDAVPIIKSHFYLGECGTCLVAEMVVVVVVAEMVVVVAVAEIVLALAVRSLLVVAAHTEMVCAADTMVLHAVKWGVGRGVCVVVVVVVVAEGSVVVAEGTQNLHQPAGLELELEHGVGQ